MKIIQVLSDALCLLKKLLNELNGKRSLIHLLTLAFAVSFGAGFMLAATVQLAARIAAPRFQNERQSRP